MGLGVMGFEVWFLGLGEGQVGFAGLRNGF